ncbi:ABC transporter related [Gluconacetobacter diazotrophicus PA1 5]|uniref:Amino acid ABC transporter ATP-binding protein n=2 Tax=Gluconacetobacter diazotrophicus TaxID=33996 RepID=A0A7W4I8M0_GLUDI|nr:amino acid ABC transporter ATP-binding protein [Gluconacetobacter diazotrophicus]ACI52434.1 ABC transporter related [Gluconacetobacter diazotrophicus PA1 5]MBB2158305.1 amino acid ABC transporter ATP-binding protein [Gluconacetobacter diazotrophicus]TWB00669.1 amino acid ABC transporter ATP-binding protein (PAAT family) [Gluconacetobacter diazotrophicus]CAP57771.1 putative ABC transporter [Gluconacetobacter diazotrophicus PA1 5]
MITVQNLQKSYGGFQVLHNVSLTVARGEKIAILGPSGSGKSTLVRCFNRIEPHDAGTIVIDGTRVDQTIELTRLRCMVGLVFQNYNLFPHLSVLENCTLSPRVVKKIARAEAEDLAMNFLHRVNIADQAGKYPIQLSGGQQQRVAIARALCMQPSVMLFDEPTAALDPEAVSGVVDIIDGLAADAITTLCVTHDMGFARRIADRILFMDRGRILEDAPPETFFTQPRTDRAREFLSQMLRY